MVGTELPAYLWGIETRYCGHYPFWLRALPAYLWGIETAQRTPPPAIRFRYQPTYEELKQNYSEDDDEGDDGLPAYLWGIETR